MIGIGKFVVSGNPTVYKLKGVDDFGGRYDEATVKQIMEPAQDEPEEDIDEAYRWLHDEVGF